MIPKEFNMPTYKHVTRKEVPSPAPFHTLNDGRLKKLIRNMAAMASADINPMVECSLGIKYPVSTPKLKQEYALRLHERFSSIMETISPNHFYWDLQETAASEKIPQMPDAAAKSPGSIDWKLVVWR
jgi:hypothetical protein